MPEGRKRMRATKDPLLMMRGIETEGYDDKILADDVMRGFSLWRGPKSEALRDRLLQQ